jgi:hypothetical protein
MRELEGPFGPSRWVIGPVTLNHGGCAVDCSSMEPTIDLAGAPDVIDRTRVRWVDSLIPVVQRAAGPSAVLRDTRLVVGVLADGRLATRLVSAGR